VDAVGNCAGSKMTWAGLESHGEVSELIGDRQRNCKLGDKTRSMQKRGWRLGLIVLQWNNFY